MFGLLLATTFTELKQALVQAPVLALPNFQKPFILETDASDIGFGAVLMQDNHPIAYLSKDVCAKNQSMSTYEKECLAIILAVDKWRSYLQHQEFIITKASCISRSKEFQTRFNRKQFSNSWIYNSRLCTSKGVLM